MKKTVLLTFLMFFVISVHSQQQVLNSVDMDASLTPSPSVATLGTFGGIEVKKSTGGIAKSISLFNLKEGEIEYNPQIDYFSTGVKVNEWGGRLGITWSDNFTAVIYRSVRGLPDEKSTEKVSHLGDTAEEIHETLLGMKNSQEITSGKDGEYDRFSYNIFGRSGEFILVNNEPVLLNHQEKIKIELLNTNPFRFLITTTEGTKYYFGVNSDIEYSQYDYENACDIDSPNYNYNLPTAWFLSKIISPKGDELLFHYASLENHYIYDFNESLVVNDAEPLSFPTCIGFPQEESFIRYDHLSCFRSQYVSTKYLTSVEGLSFHLEFTYTNREDIYGDKLLTQVQLKNNRSDLVSKVRFEYDKIGTAGEMGPQGEEGLPIRYFLKNVSIKGKNDNESKEYQFSYINPGELPPRFSTSQDIAGYYNGKRSNSSLIPKKYVEQSSTSLKPQTITRIPKGDRSPSSVAETGILNKIIYPTGGSDTVSYELNTYTTGEQRENLKTIEKNVLNNNSNYPYTTVGVSPTFRTTLAQRINMNVTYYYAGEDELIDNAGEEYYIEFQLWDKTNNKAVTPIIIRAFNEDPEKEKYSEEVSVNSNTDYELRYTIYGKSSMIFYEIKYIEDKYTVLVEKPFYGMRVKEVVTDPGDGGAKMVKSYDYRKFQKENRELKFSEEISSSPEIWQNDGGFMSPVYIFCHHDILLKYYKFNSRSIYDINAFHGSPIAYSQITEFQNQEKTSFIAEGYWVSRDEPASYVLGTYTPYYPWENKAWNHGLPFNKFYGSYKNGRYVIDKIQNWIYKADVTNTEVFSNYTIYVAYNHPLENELWVLTESYEYPFGVTQYHLYSRWFGLTSFRETNYNDDNAELSVKTEYNYYDESKMISEKFSANSIKQNLITRTFYPDNISSRSALGGGDLTNEEYNAIKRLKKGDLHRVAEPVQEETWQDGVKLFTRRTTYKDWGNNQILPEKVWISKGSSALKPRIQYHKYDSYGNLLELSIVNGPDITYLWGYNGQYPVVKIENATYADVVATGVNLSVLKSISSTDAARITELNKIRNHASMANAQVTTYTYNPLIGVSTITDPRGEKTTYTYDSFNRLEFIKDETNKLLEEYKYHYKN